MKQPNPASPDAAVLHTQAGPRRVDASTEGHGAGVDPRVAPGPGDVLAGRFRVEERAGAGGMGVVFRATDLHDGGSVGLKCVRDGILDSDRFVREAAVLARIDHPRVVRYVDHGVDGATHYLAMEWLAGEDLAARLARGRLGVDDCFGLACGLAEALAELHAHGVVHRDIKPSNVFLPGGRIADVKLLDLGIARTRDIGWTITGTGMAIGTPAYMAPEQARGEPVDARADVFSLGVLLFECLAGQPPFAADHPIAALARMLLDDAPRLSELGVAISAEHEELIAQMLLKDRERRPADGAAVLALLGREQRPRPTSEDPTALSDAEQRVVSVVLTRPAPDGSATLLPQESGALEQQVRALAAAYGVRVESLANGSFLAAFSGDGAPTDHAARAARFARALAAILGADGIAVATGRGELRAHPVGAVIGRAVALLADHGAGIRIDGLTAALLEGRFDLEGADERWQIVGERDRHEPRRTLLGRATACVGRDRELGVLATTLAACIDEPAASATLIVAPPGVGKSRLVGEFVRSTRERPGVALVLAGGCDALQAGSAFGVLGRALRATFAARDAADLQQRICERLRGRLPAAEAARVAALLTESCGHGRGDDDPGGDPRRFREDPVVRGDAIVEAWRVWLAAECDAGAVVVVLEDLHWGDLASFKVLDAALRGLSDRPLCVVGTARPELHDRFPRLWVERGVQELRLGHLSRRSAERLARRHLAGDELVARVVDRADGHPFLLEELIRAAAGGASLVGDVPESVLGMLEARLFARTEGERAALRAASVYGMRFTVAGAEALVGDRELAPAFASLAAAEFVESDVGDPRAYIFRHALVRDAAYATLVEADRVTGHRLAGDWLERVGDGEAVELAEHFDQGGASDRAAPWYHRAAEDALEGNDLPRATYLAGRAIACGRDGHERGLSELILADAAYFGGDLEGALGQALAARERFPAGSDAWFSATGAAIGCLGQRGRNDEVEAQLARAADACTSPASDAQLICLARGISQLAWISAARPRPYQQRLEQLAGETAPGALAHGWIARVRAETLPSRWYRAATAARAHEEARLAFERAGALRHATLMHVFHGMFVGYAGRAPEALAILDAAIVDVARRGLVYLSLFARVARAIVLFFFDDDGATDALDELVEPSRGSTRIHALILQVQGVLALDAGDLEAASSLVDRVCALPLSDSFKVSAYGLRARLLVALGRADEARDWGERALGFVDPDLADCLDELGVLGLAEARLAAGDTAGAREVVAVAWDSLERLPLSPDERASCYGRRIVRDLVALAGRLGLASRSSPAD